MDIFDRNRFFLLLIIGLVIAAVLGGYYWQSREEEPRTGEEALDYKPPIIEDLHWKPTKVVNDRVYDCAISFQARDEGSIIAKASVKLVPKIYPHLSPEAFPNESIRDLLLEPLDGEFDENIEDFLVNISDIVGGREYEIQVLVEDNAKNMAKSNLTTTYIREYENLGKLLFNKGLVIGVSYYEYYPDPVPWKIVLEPVNIRPLLGKYDVRDPIVIAKHIDWATGHGINCFFLPWGWDDELAHKSFHENYVNLVSSPMINQLHIAIQYEVSRVWFHGVETEEGIPFLDEPEKWKGVIEDFRVLNNTFFTKDNFFKIQDKPVVFWYGASALTGDVKGFIEYIRSSLNRKIFFFSDQAHINVIIQPDELGDYERVFDGWSTWAASWYVDVDEPMNENFPPIYERGYNSWRHLADFFGKPLMPSVIPGFVELRDPDWISRGWNLPRDVEMFSKELEVALKYATLTEGKKIIKIDTWNDFGEGDAIEPTIEEGFAFLEALKEILSAPIISNLSWTPIDVRNDKIYSLRVNFEAEDIVLGKDKPGVSRAEFHFVPGIYEHLSKDAFPDETIRSYELTPIDGIYDETKEEFTINITDIIGGREYEVIILLTDKDGNKKAENMMIPYIREFENFGKQLYDKGIRIGTVYGLMTDQHAWDDYLNLGGPFEPLLGYYVINSTKDLIIIQKHLDYMSGHGINFVAMPGWMGTEPGQVEYRSLYMKMFLDAIDILEAFNMKFAISYDVNDYLFYDDYLFNFNMSNSRNIQIIKRDLSLLTEHYFNHPTYLTIDGKPFFWIFDTGKLYGNVIGGLQELYDFINETYGIQLYMVSDISEIGSRASPFADPPTKELAKLFETFLTGWHPGTEWYHEIPDYEYEDCLLEGYEYWYSWSVSNELDFISSTHPGWSDKYNPWVPSEYREEIFPRTLELWKKRIAMTIPYSDTFGMIFGDFNCFMEGCHLEPTFQEGFAYLKALKDVITFHVIMSEYNLYNFNLTYNKDLLNIISSLVEDGKLDEVDKIFIDWISNYGENWVTLKGLLYNVTGDGVLTSDEMNLIDTVSIIPNLVSSFDAFERVPERVYQGQDLTSWEIVVSDHVEPISIEEVDFINYGNYSDVRSNVRLKCLMPLAACFFGKADERLYDFIHISGYRFRIPFTPRATGDQDVNCEIIGGGFQTWHGPSATGYEMGWGWTLNPWSEFYGYIGCTDIPIADKITPDNKWHSVIFIFDKKNDNGYFLFDDRVFEVKEFLTGYNPEWREEKISGALVVEVSNAYPGEYEDCYRNMGVLQVKDWFWIWEPYGEDQ